jgi:uncharacterized cofD-like protein
VLSVHGRVLPSTLHDVKLIADMQVPHSVHEIRVQGESLIPQMAGRVRRVWLDPNNAPAFPPVIQYLLAADLILIGPGSLYTSLLPSLLVQDIIAAIQASRAVKIFVCNIATQSGETDGYSCYDHVRALEEHIGEDFFDIILCNQNYAGGMEAPAEFVRADDRTLADSRLYCADLLDEAHPWLHDSAKLGRVVMDLFNERTGPLSDRLE